MGTLVAAGLKGLASSGVGVGLSTAAMLYTGYSTYQTSKQNTAHIAEQRETERRLNFIRDQRTRDKVRQQLATQRAELASRGIQLDSPTAIMLGRDAAEELEFQSAAVRRGGEARDQELSAEQRMVQARGKQALFGQGLSAAGFVLQQAPDLWPGLYDDSPPQGVLA